MKRVVVHIDRLVLKGFPNQDWYALAGGLQQELGRLFAEPNAARQLAARGNVWQLKVGSVRVSPNTAPAKVGTQAARGIAREIKS
jgi:hypothetical protein